MLNGFDKQILTPSYNFLLSSYVLVSVLRSYLEYMRIFGGYFPVRALQKEWQNVKNNRPHFMAIFSLFDEVSVWRRMRLFFFLEKSTLSTWMLVVWMGCWSVMDRGTYSGSKPIFLALCLNCCFCLSFSSTSCKAWGWKKNATKPLIHTYQVIISNA